MKRLLYILLLLPLFVHGQLLSTDDYTLPDYAFKFNGTDNFIDCGVKVQGQTPIDITVKFSTKSFFAYQVVFGCQTANSVNGIKFRINSSTGILAIVIGDGTSYQNINTFTLSINTLYLLNISWSGISGDSIYVTLNGTTNAYLTTKDWIGDSYRNLNFGYSYYYLYGKIYYYKYTINNSSEVFVPVNEGLQDTVYDVNSGTKYHISGTVNNDQWVRQSDYSYNQNYGCTKVSYGGQDIYIPYKTDKTPIYDHSQPVINAAETYKEYPYHPPRLIMVDGKLIRK